MDVPTFARYKTVAESRADQENFLSYAVGLHVRGERTRGSDQNFEIDAFVHEGARTPFVFNGISNLLTAPGSFVREARSNGAGGHVAGLVDTWRIYPSGVAIAPTGRINTLIEFEAARGIAGQVGERWSFVDHDPSSRHVLRGRTLIDQLDFSNGWSLRTNGDSLELWDARGIVHRFR